MFDDVSAIIFMTAISEFDQTLFEDKNTNRIKESLTLFEEICNHKLFKDTPMILFLNKKDVLEHKLGTLRLSDHFPDYKGTIHHSCSYV